MSSLPADGRNTLIPPIRDRRGRDMAEHLQRILTTGPNHVSTTICPCSRTSTYVLVKPEMGLDPVATVGAPCPHCATRQGTEMRAIPLRNERSYITQGASWVLKILCQSARRVRDGVFREVRQTKMDSIQFLTWAANNKCRAILLLLFLLLCLIGIAALVDRAWGQGYVECVLQLRQEELSSTPSMPW